MKISILPRLFASLHRIARSASPMFVLLALAGAFTTTATAAIATLGTQSSQYSIASTLSFTVDAGTDRLLVVALGDPNTATNPTAVIYNSTAMLQANATADLGFSNDAIWYLKLGTGGAITANIVVTFASGGDGTSKRFIGASAYSGVDQTTPVDINGPKISGSVTTTGSSLNVTSQPGDLVFDLFDSYLSGSQATVTTGAGQTRINDGGGAITPSGGNSHYTTSTEAGASTVTMSWTGNAGAVLHLTMNINASAAVVGPTIIVSPSSVALGTTTAGTASTPVQTFSVSGSNLTADIAITPPANVELSKDSGASWQSSLTLTQTGGTVSNTAIQARIPASATAVTSPVSVTGNITSASTGATTQNVSVTGTVYPIPVVTFNLTSQSVANNANTTPVTFSSPVIGTTYTWTNNNTTIGIGASGSGSSIASFTATNTGNTPVTATFTVTPTANSVAGVAQTFTITVNPTPVLTINPTSQTVADGANTTAVTFSSTVAGTTYTWTNNNTTIGIGASGSGSSIASFTATNAGIAPVTATFTVTPTATSVVGVAKTFTITVNPTPVPAITSATYDASTGILIVTGTGFLPFSGANNDIDVSKLSITGDSTTYTLTSGSVEITNSTTFSVTLNPADQAALTPRLNKNGTSSFGGVTYNLAAAEDWAAGANIAANVADLTGNGITVSNSQSVVTNYTTPGAFTFTVPPGVTSVAVSASGAQGGNYLSGATGNGGKGGKVTGVMTVTPGQQLFVYVGSQGGSNSGGVGGTSGGTNAGENGGTGGTSSGGAGGGAASDVRTDIAGGPSGATSLNSRVFVGGGGGGASFSCSPHLNGGIGGYPAGGNGAFSCSTAPTGGGQSAGGTGTCYSGNCGTNGGFGFGGVGIFFGGGGGGGYYGGGAGGEASGAGGSSFAAALGTTDVVFINGAQTGNGAVSISYLAVAPVVTLATTSVNADASTLTIAGARFDTTAANNTVAFTPAGTGTVTAAAATSLTVSVSGLRAGALNVVVTNGNGNSGTAVQVATVVPVITSSTANLGINATTLTINGFGFDPTAGNNTVAFSPAGTGTVTAATATSLTVTGISNLTFGVLNAVVTSNSRASASTQVATVVSAAPLPVPTSTGGQIGSGEPAGNGSGVAGIGTWDTLRTGAVLAANGDVGFRANLLVGSGTPPVTNQDFQGIWEDNGTTTALKGRAGSIAPGTGNAVWDQLPLNPWLASNGRMTFGSLLRTGIGSPVVTSNNDGGVWSELGDGTLKLLLRESTSIPGIATFVVDLLPQTVVASSTVGNSAFTIRLRNGAARTTALVRADVDGGGVVTLSAVATQGGSAPAIGGGTLGTFYVLNGNFTDPRMNDQGNIAFAATLNTGGGVTGVNDTQGVWFQLSAASPLTAIARAGATAPGTGGAKFTAFERPTIADNGFVAFRGFIDNTGDNTAGNKSQGIWATPEGNTATLVPVIRTGDTGISGMPVGSTVASVWSPFSSKSGKIAFRASIIDGGIEKRAIFTNNSGTMKMLYMVGSAAPDLAGETFDNFDHPVIGDNGHLAFTASTNAGKFGIWKESVAANNTPALLMKVGDSVTTAQGVKSVASLSVPGTGTTDRIYEQEVIDAAGEMLVFVTYGDASQGILLSP